MQSFKTLALAGLTLIPAILGHKLEFTAENFDSEISKGNWLVMFYSPKCKYSQRMLAPFNEATELQAKIGKERGFHYAKIDCLENSKLCTSQKITGYPTLNVYAQGKLMEEYLGDSNKEQLANYIDQASSKYAKQ